MTEQKTLTPIEAINEFYRLKDKYESEYYEKYVKPIIKSNKSKREKRIEYSKLPKHECINCKRNVGTIFTITNTKELLKKFIAKCGDFQEPCPLDIQILYATRDKFDKLINIGLAGVEDLKLRIIKEKNNAIFFNKNVVSIFDEITQDLKTETENVGFIIETNLLRNDNPEKRNLLNKTIDEFGKGCILPFKEMVKEYVDTNNELVLNTAVNFYINEFIPKLKEIQSLKYDVTIVEFDNITNMYNLIQLPNSLESNEFFIESDDKVVKFIRGVRKEKKKTRKEEIDKPKKKTRKIKPIAEIVLEEDVEEPLNEEPLNEEPLNEEQEPVAEDITLESKFEE